MKTYKLKDIFGFSVNVEEQGHNFYEKVTDCTGDKRIKKLFDYLGKQEVEHAKVFLKFHHLYSKGDTSIEAGDELIDVLDVVIRGLIFPDISEVRDSLAKEEGLVNVLKIAMEVELNSIIFYQKVKDLIKSKQAKQALGKIINEEESHLVKLKDLRMDFDPLYAGLKYGKFF